MFSTPDVARVQRLNDNLRVLPRRFAWAFLLILVAAIPAHAITQYSGVSMASDGSINGWGVTDAYVSGMFHIAYASTTLKSPKARTASSGWRSASNWVRADSYLGWDATDLGTYLATTNHKFYCPYAGLVYRPNTSGSTTVYDFTVTLSAQEVLPRDTGTPYQLTVTVQTNPYVSKPVTFQEARVAGSGGHPVNHPATLPPGMGGSFNPASDTTSSSTGRLTSTYTAPIFGGEQQIKATIEGRTKTAPTNLRVKVPNLAQLTAGGNFYNSNSDQGQIAHPDNWWGTSTTLNGLLATAINCGGNPNCSGSALPYNDISLKWGGKFDGNLHNWTDPGHLEHKDGKDCDVNVCEWSATRKATLEGFFIQSEVGGAIRVLDECSDPTKHTWHVDW